MRRIRIKMCGTTRIEDVRAAIAAGIDALGCIFVEESPRYVHPERAAALFADLPPFIGRAGVFRDMAEKQVREIVDRSGLTHVQLHGNESPLYCHSLREWRRSLSICKAFRVGTDAPVPDLQSYTGAAHSILLDTYIKGTAGGTGQCFDWSLVKQLSVDLPLILAGGLHPNNVIEALRSVAPYAIDINSGVELQPGCKDHHLLGVLVEKVRRYELSVA